MSSLKGKKLLVLGGKAIMKDIVVRAKELGVYTIVIDNRSYEVSPAKQIANKYYNISFSDIDKVLELINQEHIDGVLTGFTDSYLEYYKEICEKGGLPCYGGSHQFKIATDKSAFKKACVDAGVPVIPGREVTTLEEAKKEAEKHGYPVILKPADNSGSRGVVKCIDEKNIDDAFSYAMSFSSIGVVIVEKFMDCENIATSYFAANGDVRLTTTCERKLHISEDTGSSITSYTLYPSKYTDRYINEVNDAVIGMLQKNGFNNGMIAFQTFVDNKSFYFCEMCFRPSGGHHYILIQDQNKVDEMALLIEFAVSGNCRDSWKLDKETPYFENDCAMVKVIGTTGKVVHRFDGVDKVSEREEVIKIIPMCNIGDTVGADGTTAQVLATIWYRCKDGTNPEELAEDIASDLIIEDEQGESIARISIM
ncbi:MULTISPECIES: acetyl-CoA carboxylase biotin carboxylase subunit family protein [unclassified Ruminococcus]|uniref:ATP-grasp domain-containing protein n=1 Tax=unclassified Ruminococcus TaxID=2608920 RepID=UPI00210EEF5D|nr:MULTISPECIES: ATP-grasp domain-containing protein [unclassified Ruminococcus]MCQ4022547.1 ATP-grasp domain-containing protein [Ruminococcus sp. zg-924]MCQ4114787.1 ATP-grasp domain-containing protein [Ruminococcus sp. zg-921]